MFMTDQEWKDQIHTETNEQLINDLIHFGCDPYCGDLWLVAIEEIRKRLCGGNA